MAKAARRSVASDPSSPTSYSKYHPPRYRTESLDRRRSVEGQLQYHSPEAVIARTTLPPDSHSSSRFENANTSTIRPSGNATLSPKSVAAERERIRMEFYATYDVMTGVRIAATLGGFFGLMVILVMYKSRSHTNEALKDPNIAAAAAAVVQEEEERELQEVLEASGLTLYSDECRYDFQRRRLLSLGNVSAPPTLMPRSIRFSSFGGYSSLMEPPRRYSYGGTKPKCSSESSRVLSAYQMGDSVATEDFIESDDEHEVDDFDQTTITAESGYPSHLSVPQKQYDSRRSSGITCCSTESSYLERRCSAITLGIHSLAPISSRNHSRRSSRDAWDVNNFPNINIIQPTPKTSPCPSEGNINERTKLGASTIRLRRNHESAVDSFDYISEYPDTTADAVEVVVAKTRERSVEDTASGSSRRAPLASLSSFKISSIDYQDSDLRSLGSDSVFVESYADTDEDMAQFSTDSDDVSDGQSPPRTKRATIGQGLLLRPVITTNLCTSRDNSCSSEILPKSNSLSTTFQTRAVIERRTDDCELVGTSYSFREDTPHSYNGNGSGAKSKAMVKSKSAEECVMVSVVAMDSDQRSTSSGPAVTLELPVITTQQQQQQNDEQPIDPSVPDGTSRKWSKETLF
ncbi:L-lactate dehydrogenase [Sergentomyia squamirostris]